MRRGTKKAKVLQSVLLENCLLLRLALLCLRRVTTRMIAFISSYRSRPLYNIRLPLIITQVILVDSDLLFGKVSRNTSNIMWLMFLLSKSCLQIGATERLFFINLVAVDKTLVSHTHRSLSLFLNCLSTKKWILGSFWTQPIIVMISERVIF